MANCHASLNRLKYNFLIKSGNDYQKYNISRKDLTFCSFGFISSICFSNSFDRVSNASFNLMEGKGRRAASLEKEMDVLQATGCATGVGRETDMRYRLLTREDGAGIVGGDEGCL
ncbi:hypothetical protein L6452_00418 [Arctium lappa]|uniref:Uncharacterized protein n=1 Tax=Arctium lappa TaxID=4217 RepID=A0ACB9FFB3_ARCLA|nr:hypothetical protein L6452_00418 [Arctium lappa]